MTREEAIKVLSEFPMFDNSFKFKEACEVAIKYMKENKPSWILCEDRMPENSNEDKIVITSGGAVSLVSNYYNGFNTSDDGRGKEHQITDVIAWFPLPEPLKRPYEDSKPKSCGECIYCYKYDPETCRCNKDGHFFEETFGVITERRDRFCPLDEKPKDSRINAARAQEEIYMDQIETGSHAII